ncbi:MAG: molybdate ABC transporter permease subunit [Anaerolineae bacterium]|nr:MAG: molybdate ABC transporter permease subunit [Anaerolineae bacterium]
MTDSPNPERAPRPERPAALLVGLALLLSLVFILPLAALLARASNSDWLGGLAGEPARQALALSLTSSALATGLAVLLGTPLAYGLARWQFRGRRLLQLLVDLPIVLPPSVAGLSLLLAFGRRGVFGSALGELGVSLPFTFAAVVLAQLFVAGPLYVRSARAGFRGVDSQLEEAARTEGASDWQMFRYVMVPEIRGAILSGLVLCWARALGEFGATILFAGNLPGRTQTMPLAIYLALESQPETALGLAVVLLGASGVALWLVRLWGGED